MSLHFTIKRLQSLQDKCGCNPNKKKEAAVDMSKMTEYERAQYRCADAMSNIRSNIRDLEQMPESASTTAKVDLRQRIRKDVNGLDRLATEAKKWAKEEGRREEYEKLLNHTRKTQQMWSGRFSEGSSSQVDPSLMSPSGKGATKMDEEMSQLSAPMVNLHEDEEFAQFFEQTKKNDEEIDQALDQISAGVGVLHNQAKEMSSELKVHKVLIDEAEKKTDKITNDLVGLNKKLKKTIKEVQKDRLCLYVICFVLLIALAGTIYFVSKSN